MLLSDARLSFADDEVIAQWQERQREELARWQEWLQSFPPQPVWRVRGRRRSDRKHPARSVPLFTIPPWWRRLPGALRFGVSIAADSFVWDYLQARSLRPRQVPGRFSPEDNNHSSLPTVVLIPGFLTNWQFMMPIAETLTRLGLQVRVLPQLGFMLDSVEALAEQVIDDLRVHADTGPVVFVTHSKGGLVAKRVLLADPEGELALGAVTISAPFAGARAARLVSGTVPLPYVREVVMLRPGTPAMLDLARETAANSRITTISPIVDEIVGAGGALPGARNIAVSSIGHNLLLADARVHRIIVREVRRLVRADAANES
ncbi:hypothetical protein EG850_03295 [Gulosibacter macacae]|uniref:Alpha/beta hydrolase n=1 Tax=Gulosibacter macacae TaxID=2488791 RepID=A0A3P3W584_9MICO|nr:hypothetical protein [Gulosibacter macacae]RRJ87893.1 hypothetical protein EG850_03295 [Gulosibacter macacae]